MAFALRTVYLHYVFDLWAQAWRQKQACGDVIIVRFADDIVVGFEVKSDAVRFWAELIERMRKFSLELHPEKTRLLEFGPFAAGNRMKRGDGKPETFNFLGFSVLQKHTDSKTENGRRFVPLSDRVLDLLRGRCGERREGWIFPAFSASGHLTTVDRKFRDARREAELPEKLVLYCRRHDYECCRVPAILRSSCARWGTAVRQQQ